MDQVTAASVQQQRTEVTNLKFVACVEISRVLSPPIRSHFYGGLLKLNVSLLNDKVLLKGYLENKLASPPGWQSMVNFYWVQSKVLEMNTILGLKKHFGLWCGHKRAKKDTYHKVKRNIETRPIRHKPIRAGERSWEKLCMKIERELKAGVLKTAQSEWASTIVLVPYKDEIFRFCVDYLRLNAATIPEMNALPRRDDYINSLRKDKVFTALDTLQKHLKIPITDEDKEKSKFHLSPWHLPPHSHAVLHTKCACKDPSSIGYHLI